MYKLMMILSTYVVMYVLGFLLGRLSRKNIVFSVTIDERHLYDKTIKTYKKNFTSIYAVVMGLVMAVLMYFEYQSYSVWYFIIFTSIWLVFTFVLFVYFNKIYLC